MSSKTLKNSVLVLENYLEGYRYPPAFNDTFNAANLMMAGIRSTEGDLAADATPRRRDRDAESPAQTSDLQQLPRGKRDH